MGEEEPREINPQEKALIEFIMRIAKEYVIVDIELKEFWSSDADDIAEKRSSYRLIELRQRTVVAQWRTTIELLKILGLWNLIDDTFLSSVVPKELLG